MAPHAIGTDGWTAHENQSVTHPDRFLKVLVLGAGIAGLSAAIGLRRAGHKVEVFEQSSFANETGAAIHVCPNASRILLSWGLDPIRARFDVTKSGLTAHADTLQPIYEADYGQIVEDYGSPWYLAHRVDLHNALKELAFSDRKEFSTSLLHLRSKVVAIDNDAASVLLADGSRHQGDLIVAADGVHSGAVKQVVGHSTQALPTGSSAFRFLIPTNDILEDSRTRHFLHDQDGRFKIFVGKDGRRLVWYPCRDGTVQNFVGIHPDNERFRSVEDWNVSTTPANVLKEFEAFHPDLKATIEKANDVKLWKLLYREPIPIWHRGRLLLIGDAAHPMLPHQGQAGAQSIEDGAALGVIFSGLQRSKSLSGTEFNLKIEDRLAAFEKLRRQRASVMQIFSNAGQDEAEKVRADAERLLGPGIKVPSNQAEFHKFNFGYDVVAEGRTALDSLQSEHVAA